MATWLITGCSTGLGRALAQTVLAHGHNAVVTARSVTAVEEADDADIRQLFDTNFFGAVSMIKAVLPGMRANRSGSILNISSIGARISPAGSGYYSASKVALEGLSGSLHKELQLGITVADVRTRRPCWCSDRTRLAISPPYLRRSAPNWTNGGTSASAQTSGENNYEHAEATQDPHRQGTR